MSWILTTFRDGLPLFGHPTAIPAKIGYICADRGWATANYWLTKSGYPDIAFYSLADDLKFQPMRLRNKLTLVTILGECIDRLQLPPGSLLCVDPIALFMGGNLNDYQACACACLEIRRLCIAREITLWGLAHASKQKADKKDRYERLQDRINGSAAQLGYGDTQMYLASPEETGEKFYTFLWHSHTALPAHFPLGRNSEGLFVPWAESVQASEEGAVLAAIPSDGTAIAIAVIFALAAPASRATVYRRLTELIAEGLIERPDEGLYRRRTPN